MIHTIYVYIYIYIMRARRQSASSDVAFHACNSRVPTTPTRVRATVG